MINIFKRRRSPLEEFGADLSAVEKDLHLMGYELASDGASVSQRLLTNRYSSSEAAAYIAKATLARDIKRFGESGTLDREVASKQGDAILATMRLRRDQGAIRPQLWESDSRDIIKITSFGADEGLYLQKILNNSVVAGKKLASHWLEHI